METVGGSLKAVTVCPYCHENIDRLRNTPATQNSTIADYEVHCPGCDKVLFLVKWL